jgi:hypothetical protein
MPEPPTAPTAERRPAWRAAALAYRQARREGASHHAAMEAAGCRSNGQSLRQRMPQPRSWLPSHTHPVAHQEQICR